MSKRRGFLEAAIRSIKIEIDEKEQALLFDELERFLIWLEPLRQAETGAVEPRLLGHAAASLLREDLPVSGECANLTIAAPNFEDGYYLVPPIIE